MHINFWPAYTWLEDHLGTFTDAILTVFGGLVAVLVFYFFGIGGPIEWAKFVGFIVTIAVTILFTQLRARKQEILLASAMSYLVNGRRSELDNFLLKLISGGWLREVVKPGDVLFGFLEKICRSADWETRRLIAEALPSLGEIDVDRAVKIAALLRDDWESQRWKSDIRRRVVESLVMPALPGRASLLNRARLDKVKPLLKLREGDEVYTGMAVAEVLEKWELDDPAVIRSLLEDMKEFSKWYYSPEQNQAIDETTDLLKMSKYIADFELLEKIKTMSQSPNVLVRLAAVRNVFLLSNRFPAEVVNLLVYFAEPNQYKNVRRAVAKEQSVGFLIGQVSSKTVSCNLAEELLIQTC